MFRKISVNSADNDKIIKEFHVTDIANELKIKKYDFKIVEKLAKGENFLGEIKRASLKGVKINGEEDIVTLIIKSIPSGFREKYKFPIHELFKNETFLYKKYLQQLLQLQEQASLQRNDVKFKIAKCFVASDAPGEEMLIFKDMNSEGFRMYDRFKSLDSEHLFLATKTLACFHALSYAIKDKMSKEEYSKAIHRLLPIEETEESIRFLKYSASVGLKYIKSEENKKRFKQFIDKEENIYNLNRKVTHNFDKESPYGIIIHRDFWTNNLLFAYEDGKPKQIVMLDWQLSQYCTPIVDLLYLMYLCVDEETRDKYWDEVLDTYYNTLKLRLIALNCDPDKCYPETVFRSDLKEYHGFAVMNAVVMLPLLLNRKENAIDLDDMLKDGIDEMANVMTYSDAFIDRWNGVVNHFVKHNVI